jgi:hypothetical protein
MSPQDPKNSVSKTPKEKNYTENDEMTPLKETNPKIVFSETKCEATNTKYIVIN